MDAFTEADRERALETLRLLEDNRRQLRAMPRRVARRVVTSVSKRALILIGLGMMLGSLLGGAASGVAREMVIRALGGH